MKPFVTHTGIAAPLDRADVDTDQLIPKQFLKRIERTGYGPFLFNDWRYTSDGSERPDFILNHEPYRQASVLIAGANFGCGSSREHAVWALSDFGFCAVIAPSFADIFRSNSLRCGFLPVQLDDATVSQLMSRASSEAPLSVTVDLETQTVTAGTLSAHFDIEAFARHCLLNGLDEIALSEQHNDDIAAYEQKRPVWLPRVEAKTA
jgi:3-isopropylmalate/(R)-2-methylmalate dehydratase small subunit